MSNIAVVYDCTGANVGSLPRGALAAGYTTGSGGVPWSAEDWKAHPGAVRYCQDVKATDHTADVLDVESGAATFADCPPWVREATQNWVKGTRPGQRKPAIYMSASNVTSVVNTLLKDGIDFGINLVVADWNLTEAEAVADVVHRAGPFPIVGIQFRSTQAYDINVMASAWLANVSRNPAPPAHGPHRHLATGNESLDQVAHWRGTNSRDLLLRSMRAWSNYDMTIIEGLKLPKGFPYYTLNP